MNIGQTANEMAGQGEKYTLYHDPGSLCSIMARYTYALRGEPVHANTEMQINEKVCELRTKEQLSEHFLCDINANGEVPVLVPEEGNLEPIPDSVAITYTIASRYPNLLPKEQEPEIRRLLNALHDISFFSLSFAGKPEMQQSNLSLLESRLREDISERYREAIQRKIQRYVGTERSHLCSGPLHPHALLLLGRKALAISCLTCHFILCRIYGNKMSALEPREVQNNVDRTRAYLAEIAGLVGRSNTGYILSTPEPTALDGHVVVFVCRLQDIHREALVPEAVREYVAAAVARRAWQETMKGQRTVWAARP